MDITKYHLYLRELLTYLHRCDWADLLDIDHQGIHICIRLPNLTAQPINILLSVQEKCFIYVVPILKSPQIFHPNICEDDLTICITSPGDNDDADWHQSLVLLLWGVAELIQTPNFDDMMMNSTACDKVNNIVEYVDQFID